MELGFKTPYSPLNRTDEAGAHSAATIVEGARRDHGTVEGVEPAAHLATDGIAALRSLFAHLSLTGPIRLAAAGTKLYADGTNVPDVNAATWALAATGDVSIDQQDEGYKTFFVDGANCLRYFDERSGVKFDVVLPEIPGAMTASTAVLPAVVVNSLSGGTNGNAINASAGDKWHVVSEGAAFAPGDASFIGAGAWDELGWDSTAGYFGAFTVVKLDTDVNVQVHDGFLYDCAASPLPTPKPNTVVFHIVSSGSENYTGTALSFVLGTTAIGSLTNGQPDANEVRIPFEITSHDSDIELTLSLEGVLSDETWANVKYWGFRVLGDTQFAVWLYNVTLQSGTVGSRKYVRTRRYTLGTGESSLVLPSPAGPLDYNGALAPLSADPGLVGGKVTLDWTSSPTPDGYTDVLWRLEPTFTQYRFVGTVPPQFAWQPESIVAVGDTVRKVAWTSTLCHYYTCTAITGDAKTGTVEPAWAVTPGAVYVDNHVTWTETGTFSNTAFTDTVPDVSINATLNQNREAVPTPAYRVATYQDRVGIAVGGTLYLSASGDETSWSTLTPADVPDAGSFVSDADGIALPLGQYGRITAMRKFGLTTSQQFQSGLLIMTDSGYDILLQGSTPATFNVNNVRPGGICGPHACCKDISGRIVKVTPEGDVIAVDDRMHPTELSRAIRRDLRKAMKRGHGAEWVLVGDAIAARIILFTDAEAWVYDERDGGWSTLNAATTGIPLCACSMPSPDGAYAILGGDAGEITRLFDPSGIATAWTYQGPDWNLQNAPQAFGPRATPLTISAEFTGSVTFTVSVADRDETTGLWVWRDIWTGTLTPGNEKGLPRIPGARVRLKAEGAAGSVLYWVKLGVAPRN